MFKMQLPEQLTPTWKMLLLSDGSVTRHLQLLTGQHIEVVRQRRDAHVWSSFKLHLTERFTTTWLGVAMWTVWT